jgi:hypothetical protein
LGDLAAASVMIRQIGLAADPANAAHRRIGRRA